MFIFRMKGGSNWKQGQMLWLFKNFAEKIGEKNWRFW
jgi:hypothetical protein